MAESRKHIPLPVLGKEGCYGIRLESIGGLGANLCGKLLGELGAVYMGYNASSFSSYGSEKRGSPVKAYVRYAIQPQKILHNSPITDPQLIILFHEALAASYPVCAGMDDNGIIVVNTDKSPEDAREMLRLHSGTVCCIDAQELAIKSKSRLNMVMLGAVGKASGFIRLEHLQELVKQSIGKKYPSMLKQNLDGLQLGWDGVEVKYFPDDASFPKAEYQEEKHDWGWKNAPLGGANPHIGSTYSNELSASREGYIPLFIPEKCIHCGMCDSTCPDMVFQFVPGEYKGNKCYVNRGLDYHHCKGCLRCVEICPAGALVKAKERDYEKKPHFMRNKDLIAKSMDFESAGADPWITGEAYLDEKRVEGGLV